MKQATSLLGATPLSRSSALSRLFLCTCLILSGLSVVATAQTTYPKVVYLPPANSQTKSMTVDDVIKLSKAGLSDDLIIQQIKKKGQRFDLSTDQLVHLKVVSVSERVIQMMIDPTNNTVPPPAEKLSAPAAAQPALQANRQADPPSSALPTEIGVYANQNGVFLIHQECPEMPFRCVVTLCKRVIRPKP